MMYYKNVILLHTIMYKNVFLGTQDEEKHMKRIA